MPKCLDKVFNPSNRGGSRGKRYHPWGTKMIMADEPPLYADLDGLVHLKAEYLASVMASHGEASPEFLAARTSAVSWKGRVYDLHSRIRNAGPSWSTPSDSGEHSPLRKELESEAIALAMDAFRADSSLGRRGALLGTKGAVGCHPAPQGPTMVTVSRLLIDLMHATRGDSKMRDLIFPLLKAYKTLWVEIVGRESVVDIMLGPGHTQRRLSITDIVSGSATREVINAMMKEALSNPVIAQEGDTFTAFEYEECGRHIALLQKRAVDHLMVINIGDPDFLRGVGMMTQQSEAPVHAVDAV